MNAKILNTNYIKKPIWRIAFKKEVLFLKVKPGRQCLKPAVSGPKGHDLLVC